eukprot:TRINITY_DN19532_c0_g1_i1.p1 TRINITY_DN19532_c0_g1~~TRINITY_DN19532_c0_g1_i1.p1  ORF type:complete len:477 (-),score=64.34 TRINITY_DN19532_c0_g1_i1:124-1479(-)
MADQDKTPRWVGLPSGMNSTSSGSIVNYYDNFVKSGATFSLHEYAKYWTEQSPFFAGPSIAIVKLESLFDCDGAMFATGPQLFAAHSTNSSSGLEAREMILSSEHRQIPLSSVISKCNVWPLSDIEDPKLFNSDNNFWYCKRFDSQQQRIVDLEMKQPRFLSEPKYVPSADSSIERVSSEEGSPNIESGASCHQCRRKRKTTSCAAVFDKKPCKLRYCEVCLKNHYKENWSDILKNAATWLCPRCRLICSCISCKRASEKEKEEKEKSLPVIPGVNPADVGAFLEPKPKRAIHPKLNETNKKAKIEAHQENDLNFVNTFPPFAPPAAPATPLFSGGSATTHGTITAPPPLKFESPVAPAPPRGKYFGRVQTIRGTQYYEGFEKDGVRYQIGECAYFSSPLDRPYIGQIQGIFETSGRTVLEVGWFFRIEETPAERSPGDEHEPILIASLRI